ncbi:hypothetical protein [Methanotorris formicicus]|uniref:Uncharacterized protein n=1 Tax=Methanotorris formicicus Mc-S-70 TaxID=647171 RepID=H1KWC2_9EURY|nr:hypothetical protein [Methanotorris formicicus]EHP89499.1 hypothetical protein MetfoDRAFT_0095 [Methanotorris formicicus Mc-S-70]
MVFSGIDGNNKSQLNKVISRMNDYIIDKIGADPPNTPVKTPIPVFAIILTILVLPILIMHKSN